MNIELQSAIVSDKKEIISVNTNVEKYGLPYEAELKSDEYKNFEGHSVGIYIGTITLDEKDVIVNELAKTNENFKDEDIIDIIKNEGMAKILMPSFEANGNKEVGISGIDVYLPYAVKKHSIFEPTDNYIDTSYHLMMSRDIEGCKGISIYYEILLSDNTDNLYKILCISYDKNDIENSMTLKENSNGIKYRPSIIDVIHYAAEAIVEQVSEKGKICMYNEVGAESYYKLDFEDTDGNKESFVNEVISLIHSVRLLGVTNDIEIPNEKLNNTDNIIQFPSK